MGVHPKRDEIIMPNFDVDILYNHVGQFKMCTNIAYNWEKTPGLTFHDASQAVTSRT